MNSGGEDVLSVAIVDTINLHALINGDDTEQLRLFRACCDDGFFYLDMKGSAANIEAVVDDIYKLEEQLFALPEYELLHYDIDKLSPKKLNGFGLSSVCKRLCLSNKAKLPKDGIMRLGAFKEFEKPPLVDHYMPSLQTFTIAILKAANVILASLSQSLDLQPNENFCTNHQSHLSSPDLIRLLKYHAQPISEQGSSHVPHTDLGSMTFLFTNQYGLQILGAKSGEWEWMEPKAGHATINLGDCLSLLTNKRLRSCRHRVKAPSGQSMKERYSFAYFMRPDEEALMKVVSSPWVRKADNQDEVFTSGEWLRRKYAMLRRDTWKKNENWILTGA